MTEERKTVKAERLGSIKIEANGSGIKGKFLCKGTITVLPGLGGEISLKLDGYLENERESFSDPNPDNYVLVEIE